ncbi:MAG TPA: hypothetical protein PK176_12625 [Acidobacteriota bacterium]|nr:hypothetical protein [Acidobacteriota bacterium]HQM64150.1 hypothetical protein [Acidobacteriota bacterium]
MSCVWIRGLLAGLVCVLVCPALTQGETTDLTGVYALYHADGGSGRVEGYMRITQTGDHAFTVGIAIRTGDPAMDWQGNGEVTGTQGYYDWRFDDGKSGRTTFTIDPDGTLHGQVQGSGLNWRYVARKQ